MKVSEYKRLIGFLKLNNFKQKDRNVLEKGKNEFYVSPYKIYIQTLNNDIFVFGADSRYMILSLNGKLVNTLSYNSAIYALLCSLFGKIEFSYLGKEYVEYRANETVYNWNIMLNEYC